MLRFKNTVCERKYVGACQRGASGCMHDDAVQVQNYRVIRGVPRNPGILLQNEK